MLSQSCKSLDENIESDEMHVDFSWLETEGPGASHSCVKVVVGPPITLNCDKRAS